MRTKHPSGFTLIEILLAASIFTLIATISTTILISTVNTEKKTDIRSALYDDARVVMDQLANYIHNNAIDYDEYYSVNVLQNGNGTIAYGLYHGAYGSRFFHPGSSLDPTHNPATNPTDLGVECSYPPDADPKDCEVIYDLSQDENTGQNPYHGSTANPDEDETAQSLSNAFCDDLLGGNDCNNFPKNQSELYLTSPTGVEKIIIGLQTIDTDQNHALAILKLQGIDVDNNGILDLYKCADGYSCDTDYATIFNNYFQGYPNIEDYTDVSEQNLSLAYNTDLDSYSTEFSPFVPITAFRSNVLSVQFYINPLDDPFKAYAESNMKDQSYVTIVLTMQPSKTDQDNYPGGNFPTVTIRRTVSTNIYQDVESYPPTNDLQWLKDLLGGI
ncbi:MAG: type II secretion system protein [Candidatus Gracilibacteria bacterium]